MSEIGDFQDRVKKMLDPENNFQIDRPHDDKPEHVDLTQILPKIRGADKVDVDFEGNMLGGSTFVKSNNKSIKIDW